MAHAAPDRKLGPQSALLSGTDQTILGFTDNCPCNRVGMTAVDKIPDPQHLILFVAQDATDDGSGESNAGSFQRSHGSQHCRQVPFGVIGAATIHASPHNFSTEGIIAPRGYVPRGHHISVSLKHQGSLTGADTRGDDNIGSAGGDFLLLNFKSLLPGPLENIIRRRLLTGSGNGIPDGVNLNKIGCEFN